MLWRIIKNLVFYTGLLVIVAVALHYIWAPRYYFPQTEVFFGKNIFNPYTNLDNPNWIKTGIYVYPPWYKDAIESLSGNDRYYEVDEYYYDTLLYAANQKFEKNNNTYMQGLHHNDHLAIGCNEAEFTDYPFIRDIHNKQHRINMVRDKGCLLFLKPSVFYDNFKPEHPKLLRNYHGIMVDENFVQSQHIWDQALSSGIYTTLIANTLPRSSRFLPEKQYRILYINADSAGIKKALTKGNYYVATKYHHEENEEQPDLDSKLQDISIQGDSLIINTSEEAMAINFFGQHGEVADVQKNTSQAIYELKRKDSYIRTTIIFEDGTRYYLNPVHRYSGNQPHHIIPVEVNFLKTWFLRAGGIVGLLIAMWILLYIKRRLRIEVIEPKD